MPDDGTPILPSPALTEMIGVRKEPCGNCGRIHKNRQKLVCRGCNQVLCAGQVSKMRDGVLTHWETDPLLDERHFCGYIQVTGSYWPEATPIQDLQDIIEELS